MPAIGIEQYGRKFLWDEIPIDIMLPEQVRALKPMGREGVHVTDLSICPYASARKHLTKYYLSFQSAWRILQGIALDALIAFNPRHEKGSYQINLTKDLNGVTLRGTPDVVDILIPSIEDFKRNAKIVREISHAYTLQLNAYNWLLTKNEDNPINYKLFLNFCGPTTYQRMKVEKWPIEDTQEILEERINKYLVLLDNEIISSCGDENCFYCRGIE